MHDLATVRLKAAHLCPYMRRTIMSLVAVQTDKVPVMATDCYMRLYYNPKALDELSLEEAAMVVLHECMHVLYDHATRRLAVIGERLTPLQAKAWNIACDVSINDTLKEFRNALPKGCVYSDVFTPPLPRNLTTEEYYALILKMAQPSDGEDGDEDGDIGGLSSDVQDACEQGAGSSSDGVEREWDAGEPTDDNPGMGEYETGQIRKGTAQDIVNEQRQRGTVPGGLARYAESMLKPKWDPRAAIMGEVKHAVHCCKGYQHITWMRPNMREFPGTRMPTYYDNVPSVTVIVDTSGSMNADDLALAMGVVADCLKALPHEAGVNVVSGDAAMECSTRLFGGQVADQAVRDKILVGGGGTDMGQIMLAAIKEFPRTDVMIVATDGYTPWPETPLKCRCLALLTQKGTAGDVPQWMRTVYIHPEA